MAMSALCGYSWPLSMDVSDDASVTASGSRQTEASRKKPEVTEWGGVYLRFLFSPWVSSTQ